MPCIDDLVFASINAFNIVVWNLSFNNFLFTRLKYYWFPDINHLHSSTSKSYCWRFQPCIELTAVPNSDLHKISDVTLRNYNLNPFAGISLHELVQFILFAPPSPRVA